MNPAVTLAVAILGRMKWSRLPVYWLAQYLGAFIAAACVFGIYYGKHLDVYIDYKSFTKHKDAQYASARQMFIAELALMQRCL